MMIFYRIARKIPSFRARMNSADKPSAVRVRGMRFRGKRRSGRCDQYVKGGTRPVTVL